MTTEETKLEVALDYITDEAMVINVESLDPIVLQGWREMCVGALESLIAIGKLPSDELDESYESLLSRAVDSIDYAHQSAYQDETDGYDEDGLSSVDGSGNTHVGNATAHIAIAYARIVKVEQDKRDAELKRLREASEAITQGVTPIGFVMDGARKGELVAVQIGANNSPTVPMYTSIHAFRNAMKWQYKCPSGCMFARWRTDGRPSTEPGYSERCDECKTKPERPAWTGERKPHTPQEWNSPWMLPRLNRDSIDAKATNTEPKCRGKCKCSHEVLYK